MLQPNRVKPSAMATPSSSACGTSARASSMRPAPSARAIAEATPPPMPPAAMLCIRVMKGTTRAAPASEAVPSSARNQVSARATATCTSMIRVVGPASRNRLRPSGAVRRGWDKKNSGKTARESSRAPKKSK
jgi:hypothetical protein